MRESLREWFSLLRRMFFTMKSMLVIQFMVFDAFTWFYGIFSMTKYSILTV